MSACLSVRLLACLPAYLFLFQFACLRACLSAFLFVCVSVCLPAYLPACVTMSCRPLTPIATTCSQPHGLLRHTDSLTEHCELAQDVYTDTPLTVPQ